MESTLSIKSQLHEGYLKFLHQHERFSETEIVDFQKLCQLENIESFALNITAVHVLDCIGRHEPINSTAISEKMELSKASITKITGKLLEERLVTRTQLKDNKKEAYFRLTPAGKEIYRLHLRLHEEEKARFFRFLDQYTEGELRTIQRFLLDYSMELGQRMAEGANP
ncbi:MULTISPECIES: MarR family transcriptional regulator [Paenibacillus]|uniref:MarR family transcriptional regulator n=1 Tax=Paenibacillus TaxID=44249 RepID=UPI002FE3CEC7